MTRSVWVVEFTDGGGTILCRTWEEYRQVMRVHSEPCRVYGVADAEVTIQWKLEDAPVGDEGD